MIAIAYFAFALAAVVYVIALEGEPYHYQLAAVGLQLFALERAMAHAGMPL